MVGLISIVWAVSVAASIVTGRYEVLQLVTPVMLVAAGWYFGLKVVREANGHHDRDR